MRRIFRLSFLGTLVMLAWLLYPTARCSWRSFVELPFTSEQVSVGQQDRERVAVTMDFFERFADSVRACYQEAPLTGQGRWKTRLFIGFLVTAVGSWLAERLIRAYRRRKQRELG